MNQARLTLIIFLMSLNLRAALANEVTRDEIKASRYAVCAGSLSMHWGILATQKKNEELVERATHTAKLYLNSATLLSDNEFVNRVIKEI